jgi:hypothetical protein
MAGSKLSLRTFENFSFLSPEHIYYLGKYWTVSTTSSPPRSITNVTLSVSSTRPPVEPGPEPTHERVTSGNGGPQVKSSALCLWPIRKKDLSNRDLPSHKAETPPNGPTFGSFTHDSVSPHKMRSCTLSSNSVTSESGGTDQREHHSSFRSRLSLNTPCRSVVIHALLFLSLLAVFFHVPTSPSTPAPTLHFLPRADLTLVTD